MPIRKMGVLTIAGFFVAIAGGFVSAQQGGASGQLFDMSPRQGKDDFSQINIADFKFKPSPRATSAALPPKVDLHDHFLDDSRDQGPVGDCDVFAATALLESAYYRHYKQKIRFSEADLFIRSVLVYPHNSYSTYEPTSQVALYQCACLPTEDQYIIKEGSRIDDVAEFAVENGIASSLAYETFAQKYAQRMGPDVREAALKRDQAIAKQDDQAGWLDKILFKARYGKSRRQHWLCLQRDSERKSLDELFQPSKAPELRTERTLYMERLKDFQVYYNQFRTKDNVEAGGIVIPGKPLPCGPTERTKRKKIILDELLAGRPVGVGFRIPLGKRWDTATEDDSDIGLHGIVIVGYETTDKGIVFKTRNSWGQGANYDFPESRLCRVERLTTVLTPGEKPQPGWDTTRTFVTNDPAKGAPDY